MNFKTVLLFGLALVVALVAGAGPAQADTLYFNASGASGDWADDANWFTTSCSGTPAGVVPAASDDVVICSGETAIINTDDAVARTIRVPGTTTKIELSPVTDFDAMLTLGSGSTALTSSLTGDLILKSPVSGHIAKLTITAVDHTLDGGVTFARVTGEDNSAQINIPSGRKLTSKIGIERQLKITGGGSFTNEGLVEANASASGAILLIDVAGTVDDSGGAGRWRASHANATLEFDSAIGTLASMQGEFCLSAGTILIEKALDTDGRLEMQGGLLDVRQDTTMGLEGGGVFGKMSASGGAILVAAGADFTHD